MKLIYKGKYDGSESSLPTREHMPGAVQFREPDSMKKLAVIANGIALAVTAACIVLVYWRAPGDGVLGRLGDNSFGFLIGYLLFMVSLFPHEILHALCFRDTVYLYTNWKQGLLFVVGTEDMSKARFVFMSLLPNIVFGFIPLIAYLIWPQLTVLGGLGALAVGAGAGDYFNVFNALTQMPKGARTYMHGMHSFWYMPK